MTTAMVTGGSGYFGSVLIAHLDEYGDKIRNFDLVAADDHPAGVEQVVGDVRDYEAIREACVGVDVVYHAAAQLPLARNRALIETVNIDGTANMLRAAADAGVAKVLFTSSSAVFGIDRSNPVTEDSPVAPAEPYGRAKVHAEQLCRVAASAGLDVTIVRPRTILGHGRLGIFGILFEWVADGVDVFVLGRGANLFQFVHAHDLAVAYRLAGQRAGPATYNLGAAEFGTMREALEALVEHAGTGAKVRSLPTRPAMLAMQALSRLRLAPFGAYHWLAYGEPLWFDIDAARRDLGWEPRHSNASMIAESYDCFLADRHRLAGKGGSPHQSPARQGALRLMKAVTRVSRLLDSDR